MLSNQLWLRPALLLKGILIEDRIHIATSLELPLRSLSRMGDEPCQFGALTTDDLPVGEHYECQCRLSPQRGAVVWSAG